MVILEEETFKKFGYYSWEWKPKSVKTIIVACDKCGKIRAIRKGSYYGLCRSCAAKGKSSSVKTSRIRKTCLTCGKPIMVCLSQIKRGKGKYCSLQCAGIAWAKNNTGENNSNWKGGEIKRKCEICGKEFIVARSRIKDNTGKYCSYKCAGVATTKYRSGKNSSSWKNGVSFEPYCYKFNESFKQYIRSKFNNVCFLCGKDEEENGKYLSAHHVNYNKNCGCAETEESRKIDNALCQFVPLCTSCNSKVNSNRDKWEKYFKDKLRNKLNGWYI